MKTAAIICEYNLFHNGHKRQIDFIKAYGGGCAVLALMSGSWVQRGEPAVLPSYVRAEAALRCGADLMLELPYPWSSSSAEYFARGAVSILNALGFVDYLCFGSESGNLPELKTAAANTLDENYRAELETERSARRRTPASDIILRGDVYRRLYGQTHPVRPNDVLGVEYLRALSLSGSVIEPVTLKREGSETATASRAAYLKGDFGALASLAPETAIKIYRGYEPTRAEKLGTAFLALLRLTGESELDAYEGAEGGLGRRIAACAASASDMADFYRRCATKRFTNARLRRTVMNCVTGVTAAALKENPAFCRLLAADGVGLSLLRGLEDGGIKLITKPAHQKRYMGDPVFAAQAELRRKAEALYSLARGEDVAEDMRRAPFIFI